MAQTTDERLMALLATDRAAFKLALEEECLRDHRHAGPFLEQAGERFGGRVGVCAKQLSSCLEALRTEPGRCPDVTHALAAASIQAALPRLGELGSSWATAMMSLGYALALADLAAVPPEE